MTSATAYHWAVCSCGQPITWTLTTKGASMPVDGHQAVRGWVTSMGSHWESCPDAPHHKRPEPPKAPAPQKPTVTAPAPTFTLRNPAPKVQVPCWTLPPTAEYRKGRYWLSFNAARNSYQVKARLGNVDAASAFCSGFATPDAAVKWAEQQIDQAMGGRPAAAAAVAVQSLALELAIDPELDLLSEPEPLPEGMSEPFICKIEELPAPAGWDSTQFRNSLRVCTRGPQRAPKATVDLRPQTAPQPRRLYVSCSPNEDGCGWAALLPAPQQTDTITGNNWETDPRSGLLAGLFAALETLPPGQALQVHLDAPGGAAQKVRDLVVKLSAQKGAPANASERVAGLCLLLQRHQITLLQQPIKDELQRCQALAHTEADKLSIPPWATQPTAPAGGNVTTPEAEACAPETVTQDPSCDPQMPAQAAPELAFDAEQYSWLRDKIAKAELDLQTWEDVRQAQQRLPELEHKSSLLEQAISVELFSARPGDVVAEARCKAWRDEQAVLAKEIAKLNALINAYPVLSRPPELTLQDWKHQLQLLESLRPQTVTQAPEPITFVIAEAAADQAETPPFFCPEPAVCAPDCAPVEPESTPANVPASAVPAVSEQLTPLPEWAVLPPGIQELLDAPPWALPWAWLSELEDYLHDHKGLYLAAVHAYACPHCPGDLQPQGDTWRCTLTPAHVGRRAGAEIIVRHPAGGTPIPLTWPRPGQYRHANAPARPAAAASGAVCKFCRAQMFQPNSDQAVWYCEDTDRHRFWLKKAAEGVWWAPAEIPAPSVEVVKPPSWAKKEKKK